LSYETGLGVPKDRSKAFSWNFEAAQQGDASAHIKLGSFNYRIMQDKVEAFKHYSLGEAFGGGDKAAEKRELVAKEMTDAQLIKAHELTTEWYEEYNAGDFKVCLQFHFFRRPSCNPVQTDPG